MDSFDASISSASRVRWRGVREIFKNVYSTKYSGLRSSTFCLADRRSGGDCFPHLSSVCSLQRGDPSRQLQEGLEPLILLFTEGSLNPGVCIRHGFHRPLRAARHGAESVVLHALPGSHGLGAGRGRGRFGHQGQLQEQDLRVGSRARKDCTA